MLDFIEVSFKNFYSFGNNITTIDLTVKDPTLILGRNISDATADGIDSNGAGKTTIINAICYALYGKTIDGNDKSGIINYINNKDLEVSILFKRGLIFYKIIRFRKNKGRGGNGVLFYKANTLAELEMKENSEDSNTDEATAGTTNDKIIEVLNKPFSVFSRVILFSAQDEPFLNLIPSLQRQIIESLCNMDEISLRSKTLKTKKDKTQIELDSEIKLYDQAKLQAESIASQMNNVTNKLSSWSTEHLHKISVLSNKIEEFTSVDIRYTKSNLKKLLTNKNKLDLLYPEQKTRKDEYIRLENNIIKYKAWNDNHNITLSTLTAKIKTHISEEELNNQTILIPMKLQLMEEINNLEKITEECTRVKEDSKHTLIIMQNELTHLLDSKCPYCLQHYSNDDKIKDVTNSIKDNQTIIHSMTSKLHNSNMKMVACNITITNMKKSLKFESMYDINKIIDSQHLDIDKLVECTSEQNPYNELDEVKVNIALTKIQDELKVITTKIGKLNTEITTIESNLTINSLDDLSLIESNLLKLSTELDSIKKETNPHRETLNELKKISIDVSDVKINKLKRLIYHQDFLYKLLTRKDSMLRKTLLSRSLPYLNNRLEIYLNNLGLPHKVIFTDDMGTSITKHNTPIKYKGLSSGQKARINIALAFAFRDLLQKRHGKTSLFLLDECLDHGLGNVGIELAAKLVKEKAIADNVTMMIITHKDEIADIFPRKLIVIHENEFSRIDDG